MLSAASITFFGGIFAFVNEFQSQSNSASVVKHLKLGYETVNDHALCNWKTRAPFACGQVEALTELPF